MSEKDETPTINGSPLETEEETYYSWKADSRLFKRRGKEYYSTVVVLALLVSVIMFFIEGVMPVLLIWSIVFAIYAVSKTPPTQVTHKLTSWGIRTDEELYQWGEIDSYWFENRDSKEVVRAITPRRFPGQLMLIIKKEDQDKIKSIMSKFVILQKPESTWSDKAVKWLGEKVPLDEN